MASRLATDAGATVSRKLPRRWKQPATPTQSDPQSIETNHQKNQEKSQHLARRGRDQDQRKLTAWFRGGNPAISSPPGSSSSSFFLGPRFTQEEGERSFGFGLVWFGLARKEQEEGRVERRMGKRKRKVRAADLFRGWWARQPVTDGVTWPAGARTFAEMVVLVIISAVVRSAPPVRMDESSHDK